MPNKDTYKNMVGFVNDFLADEHLPDSNYDIGVCEYVFNCLSLAVDVHEITWDELQLSPAKLELFMCVTLKKQIASVQESIKTAKANKSLSKDQKYQKIRDVFIEMGWLNRLMEQYRKQG